MAVRERGRAADTAAVEPRPAPSGRNIVKRRIRRERIAYGAAGMVLVLAAWELLVRSGMVKDILISSPTAVATTLVRLVTEGVLWPHLWATFQAWVLGFAAAAVVGIVVGLVAGWFRLVRVVVEPLLNVMYAAPELALVPIFILWFGIGIEFKIWLAFTSAIFVIAVNTIAGARSTEARYVAVARTYGASKLKMFSTIVLPGSIPSIMTGLRQASGRAMVGVIAAEFLSSNVGLGFFISLSGQNLSTASVMAGILVLAVFGVVTGEVLRVMEGRFEVWRDTA